MTRKTKMVDPFTREVARALTARGARVESPMWSDPGGPNLVVGYCGINVFLQATDPEAPLPSNVSALDPLRLNPAQREWHQNWQGQVHVVFSVEDALRHLDRLDAIMQRGGAPAPSEKPDGFEPPKEWSPES